MTPYPHGYRRAAGGHARLGYAGGSWWLSQPILFGDPKRIWCFNGELAARDRRNCANAKVGKDANHNRHIPTTRAPMFLEVLIQGAIIVIHGMPMNRSIGMNMRNVMTVRLAVIVGVAVRKPVVIVTGVTRRSRGSRNKRPLERKRRRCRHHDDDSNAP